jgi:hypothetical protein
VTVIVFAVVVSRTSDTEGKHLPKQLENATNQPTT